MPDLDLRSLDISLYFSDQSVNSSTEIYTTTMEHSFEPLKNDLLLRAAWGGLPASLVKSGACRPCERACAENCRVAN